MDRREDKENPDYQNLLMGNIPSEYAEKIPFTEWHKASRDMQNLMGWRRANTDLHKPFTPEEVGSSESYELLLKSYIENVKNGEKKSFDYETRRILGLNFTGFTDFVDSLTDEDIEKCSVRLIILLGKLRHKEKGKVTKEYSSMYDKSRYKFYLDAPFEISNQCCSVMKKEPMKRYAKETGRVPFTAQMASESRLRTQNWLKHGCNAFQAAKKISNPMSFWTEQDVLLYIYQNQKKMMAWRRVEYREVLARKHPSEEINIEEMLKQNITYPIASVYGDVVKETEVEGQLDFEDLGLFDLGVPTLKTTGCDRTGCVLCGYGAHREKPGEGRFERLRETHPNMYKSLDRATNSGVTMREAIEWTNEHGNLNIRLQLPTQ